MNLWGQGSWLSDLPLGTYQSETRSRTCLALHPSEHQLITQWHRKWQCSQRCSECRSTAFTPIQKPPFCQILLPPAHSHTSPFSLESTLQEFLPTHTHTHTHTHTPCLLKCPRTQPCSASQVMLVVKNLPANTGDIEMRVPIFELGRSPGGGHGNPL